MAIAVAGNDKGTADAAVTLRELHTRAQLREFVEFPNLLYRDCPQYVPCLAFDELDTLDRRKNPAYAYCEARFFMAYLDGKPVGRVCALLNREYNRCWNRRCVRFTRLDFIDDLRVSRRLLGAVEQWARQLGMDEVQGPMGFCDLDKEGMLVEGFEERNLFFTIYNYPYYVEHMRELGYEKSVDWIEYRIRVPQQLDPRITRIAEDTMKKQRLRSVRLRRSSQVRPYAGEIFDLLYEAYRPLYGVIPLNEGQVKMYVSQFITMVRPEFLSLIVDEQNRLAAFGIVVPSMSDAAVKSGGKLFPFGFLALLKVLKCRRCDTLDFLLVAVRPELQGRGITAQLLCEMYEGAQKFGARYCETGPMLEDNSKIHLMWKHFEHRQHKRRRCYIRKLS